MSISTRTRFEVFKRDRFTCAYCGRTPPEVLLHVDHIHPVAAGGSDDMANLITACSTCNLGKSSVPLEEGTRPVVTRDVVEDLSERLEQARAYMELLSGMESLTDRQEQMVTDRWAHRFGAKAEERADGTYWVLPAGQFPRTQSVRAILRRLPLEQVLEAVDITADWASYSSSRACRYFYGICWKRIRERDER